MHIRSLKDLGALLRQARRDKGWTQAELAARLGVRQASVSDIENSKRSARLDVVLAALNVLGVGLTARLSDKRSESTAPRNDESSGQVEDIAQIIDDMLDHP